VCVDGVGVREKKPTKIDPKTSGKLKYLFWKVRKFYFIRSAETLQLKNNCN